MYAMYALQTEKVLDLSAHTCDCSNFFGFYFAFFVHVNELAIRVSQENKIK